MCKTYLVFLAQHVYLTLLQILTYVSVQSAFQHGIMAPFRRPHRDPPPPQLPQPERHMEIEVRDRLAGGDAPHHEQRRQPADGQLHRNRVYKRRTNKPREMAAELFVETLRRADRPYSEDETDSVQHDERQDLSRFSDTEHQEDTQEEQAEARVHNTSADGAQSNTKPAPSDSHHSETKPLKVDKNSSKDELSRTGDAPESPAEGRPSRVDVEVSYSQNT